MLSEPNFPMWCVVEFVLFDLLLKTWPWQSFLKRTCFNSWKTKLCSNSEKCPDTGLNFFFAIQCWMWWLWYCCNGFQLVRWQNSIFVFTIVLDVHFLLPQIHSAKIMFPALAITFHEFINIMVRSFTWTNFKKHGQRWCVASCHAAGNGAICSALCCVAMEGGTTSSWFHLAESASFWNW